MVFQVADHEQTLVTTPVSPLCTILTVLNKHHLVDHFIECLTLYVSLISIIAICIIIRVVFAADWKIALRSGWLWVLAAKRITFEKNIRKLRVVVEDLDCLIYAEPHLFI